MKLLIKIFLPALNKYDLMPILDDLARNITDKDTTKMHIMLNISDFNVDRYDYSYLNENNVTKMINYKLNELDWDIILPIFRPCIATMNGFDTLIKDIYKKAFPDFDGVLWLNNDIDEKEEKEEINRYPVIGRKYYKNFRYVYNSIYNENFEKEFTEVSKLKNKSHFVKDTFFKILNMKSDDDHIYDLRKKFNFGLITLK